MRITLPAILLLAFIAPLPAQQIQASRTVHVVVNDPLNRGVTGLPRQSFDVTEDGTPRPITGFYDVNSPISLAIVGQSVPADVMALRQSGNEVIQARSVADGLAALVALKNPRKALIFTSGTIVGEIPGEIQVLKTDPQSLPKSVIGVMNSYSLRFSSSSTASTVQVNLRSPAGLPPLTVTTR